MKDQEFYDFTIQKNKEAKTIIYNTLDHLGLKYLDSSTNFVFFESGKDINELGRLMYNKGVNIGRPFPPFYNWCRISTGTLEETQLFCEGLVSLYFNTSK